MINTHKYLLCVSRETFEVLNSIINIIELLQYFNLLLNLLLIDSFFYSIHYFFSIK